MLVPQTEHQYNACPTNRAPIQRPTRTVLCYGLQHWSRDRSMCPPSPPVCVKHKMGFNIALEFCILCCGRIMKSLSVRHVDKTITKYWDAIWLMLWRHAGLIIKFELNVNVWFGSVMHLNAKMKQGTRKAKKFQKIILYGSDCVFRSKTMHISLDRLMLGINS
jgi:hypothetical protein